MPADDDAGRGEVRRHGGYGVGKRVLAAGDHRLGAHDEARRLDFGHGGVRGDIDGSAGKVDLWLPFGRVRVFRRANGYRRKRGEVHELERLKG